MKDQNNFASWDSSIWDFKEMPPKFNNSIVEQNKINSTVIIDNLINAAFYGQKGGAITFSDGTSVSIGKNDSRSTVLSKLKNAGIRIREADNHIIFLSENNNNFLSITSDETGWMEYYGLLGDKTYSGSVVEQEKTPLSSTITGSVNVFDVTGEAFYGQKTGMIRFSDGTFLTINKTDSLTDVIQKLNDAGLNATINGDGKI